LVPARVESLALAAVQVEFRVLAVAQDGVPLVASLVSAGSAASPAWVVQAASLASAGSVWSPDVLVQACRCSDVRYSAPVESQALDERHSPVFRR
jgi:hypothetical protein